MTPLLSHPVRTLAGLLALCLLLSGCGSGPVIDTRYTAQGQDSRVQYVIIHYTSSGSARALNTLTTGEVSSHYLIDREPPTIYRLVDENRRAWHAGDSSWQGRTWLNANSIGIEVVHPGYRDTAQGRQWYPWEQAQIDQLIVLLQDILHRHELPPERVIGHSDVAPQRKLDPGPLFPWWQLAEAGVSIWPDPTDVARYQQQLGNQVPPSAWFEMALERFGYNLARRPDQTHATRNLIAAFQMRFRPGRFDGQPDVETAALLAALVPSALDELPRFPPDPQPETLESIHLH